MHKWSSLVCTGFMLLLCITGLPLIFHHEIDHLLGHSAEPPALAPGQAASRADLDAVVADARARRPDLALQFLVRDAEEPELWHLRFGSDITAPEAAAFDAYDARTGEYLSAYPVGEGVMNVIFRLHYDLYAGLPGTLFLGAMGLLLVISLVSGVVLYGPFMRKLSFGTVRGGGDGRARWLDLHNLLGIATLVWLLVVSVTGVVNTLAVPIFSQWQSTELARMTAARPGPTAGEAHGSVAAALTAVREAAPGRELSFLAFPGNGFAGPAHFVAFMQGSEPWNERVLMPVVVDARNAEVIATAEMPWTVTALLVSQPLHFGDYGGLPLKILWALLDVIAIVVLASGLYLWLKRRSQARRAATTAPVAPAGAAGSRSVP